MSETKAINAQTEVMLTTLDNPYDYFTHFIEWNSFDVEKGYNTCCKLDRILTQIGEITDDLTPNEAQERIENAISRIIVLFPTIEYQRIYKDKAY